MPLFRKSSEQFKVKIQDNFEQKYQLIARQSLRLQMSQKKVELTKCARVYLYA